MTSLGQCWLYSFEPSLSSGTSLNPPAPALTLQQEVDPTGLTWYLTSKVNSDMRGRREKWKTYTYSYMHYANFFFSQHSQPPSYLHIMYHPLELSRYSKSLATELCSCQVMGLITLGEGKPQIQSKSCSFRPICVPVSQWVPILAWDGKASAYHWQKFCSLEFVPTLNSFSKPPNILLGSSSCHWTGNPTLGALVPKYGDQLLLWSTSLLSNENQPQSLCLPSDVNESPVICWSGFGPNPLLGLGPYFKTE